MQVQMRVSSELHWVQKKGAFMVMRAPQSSPKGFISVTIRADIGQRLHRRQSFTFEAKDLVTEEGRMVF